MYNKNTTIYLYFLSVNNKLLYFKAAVGPPPPPLPPPLKAPCASQTLPNPVHSTETQQMQIGSAESASLIGNDHDSDEIDSDFGLEVIEEPTLRPSELVRGNHNRTMSTISGEYIDLEYKSIDEMKPLLNH